MSGFRAFQIVVIATFIGCGQFADQSVTPKDLLPIFINEPRGPTSVGTPQNIRGTFRLPANIPGFVDFSSAEIISPIAPALSLQVEPTTRDGDSVQADFSATLATYTEDPGQACAEAHCEIVVMRLGQHISLPSIVERDGRVTFSSDQAALQALVLSRVPMGDPNSRGGALYFGAHPGQDAALDAAAPGVKAAIEAALLGGQGSGFDSWGKPLALSQVGRAVESALANSALPVPQVLVPLARQRLFRVSSLAPGAKWVVFMDGWSAAPTVTFSLAPGRDQMTMLVQDYDGAPPGSVWFLRYAVPGSGGASYGPRSAPQVIEEQPMDLPAAPALAKRGDAFVASGVTAGNWVVFVGGYVGFEAVQVQDGASSVSMPRSQIPQDTGYLYSLQVTPSLVVSKPSNFFFPSDF